MPKQKTHKGTKKRFRLTGTGKVKHRKCGTSHLLLGRTSKRKRQLRRTGVISTAMEHQLISALCGNSY